MNRKRTTRLAMLAVLGLVIAACGGGDDAPDPVMLWQGSSNTSGTGAGLSTLLVRMEPSPGFAISAPATGEECVQGELQQTVTGPGEVSVLVETFGFAVRAGAIRRTLRADAAGVLIFPFRLCGPSDSPAGIRQASVSLSVQPQNGRTLGAYSARAAWTFIGTPR